MDKIRTILDRYLPPGKSELLIDWIVTYRIHLHIKRDRRSKAGDYRAPTPDDPTHRISINYNLNPYAFLITLVHEFAHRTAFEKYGRKASPHGKEWKSEFQRLMVPFLADDTFPEGLHAAVNGYMRNPKASSGGDMALVKALRLYDTDLQEGLFLEELPEGALFNLGDVRVFRKGELQRKRFLCKCISNKKSYLVHAIAQVFPVEE